jgi:hypothetical protein
MGCSGSKWEVLILKGISEYRYGGPNDPLVQEIMKQKGL